MQRLLLKEYIAIVILNILHGIFTGVMLGGMPLISLTELTQTSMIGIFLWLLYGISLYMIAHIEIIQDKKILNIFVKAVGFGLAVVFVKGIIDYCIAHVTEVLQLSMMQIACVDQVVTVVFGALMISFLMLVILKRKINIDWNKAALPVGLIGMVIVVYVCMVINCFLQNKKVIGMYDANLEEMRNLDYHFAFEILDMNPWFYVILYILFWWGLRRITLEKQDMN